VAIISTGSAFATASREQTVQAKPVLKIVRTESPTTAVENNGNEVNLVEKVTGYRVEIEFYDASTAVEKVALNISGGEPIDMVLPAGGVQGQLYTLLTQLARQGGAVRMDTMFDQYAPVLRDTFSAETWKALSIDGGVYCAPAEAFDIGQNANLVRTDLLATMGARYPENLDELVSLLRRVKAEDPAGVGSNQVIPLSFSYPNFPFRAQFGINFQFVERDGKLVASVLLPETLEWVKFLKSLYDEGLLDEEFLVSKMDVIGQRVLGNRIFMFGQGHWTNLYGWRDAIDKQGLSVQLGTMPFFRGPTGSYRMNSSWGLGMGAFIPSTSKNAGHVMMYLNEWVKPQNFRTLFIGEEGVDHEIVDGKVMPILPAYNDDVGNMNLLLPVAEEATYFENWLPRTRKLPLVESSFNDVYQTNLQGGTERNPVGGALSFPTYGATRGVLATLENETIARMIMGVQKLDEWDDFIELWMESGGADAIKVVVAWYESMNYTVLGVGGTQ
jgi:putative aldouronate transport system substrate-binding protein